jgi:RND superfamily putative drug exporter
MLERLARWSFRRRRLMLGIWTVSLVGISVLGQVAGGEFSNDFRMPGTESQAAFDLLEDRFPERSGDTGQIVFQSEEAVTTPAVREAMEGLFAAAADLEGVEGVTSPYVDTAGGRTGGDGRTAFADIQFDRPGPEVPIESIEALMVLRADVMEATPGLQVEYGGLAFEFAEQEPPGGEMVGLLAAIIILLVAFGSFLAMALPILSALFGIGLASAILLLSANVIAVPFFAPQIAAMIGIGVGIDYALFIVTRHRTNLQHGMTPEDAAIHAMNTSGRAVVFAGITVVISLLGILIMGFTFVQGVAVGGASAVFTTLLASITLLPAMLGFSGAHLQRVRFGKGRHGPIPIEKQGWYRWSRVIQRRPAISALAGLAALLLLAVPLLDIRLGVADAGNAPESRTTRRAYDLLADGFGPGFNGPLLLVADLQGTTTDREAALTSITNAVRADGQIEFVAPPALNRDGDTAIITAFPRTTPQSVETEQLVNRLRADVLPQVTAPSGTRLYVSGITAVFNDFATRNSERLPLLILVVVGLSFLLLMAVFRSILVPLKAAIMNLLSIGAAYGIIVAIFQWGWAREVFGVATTGPIEAWAPMMLFVILFGLSMDYEIFLLSRIREDYLRSGNNAEAVANGLAHTARVITAAAAIMISVFVSFVFSFDDRAIKLFGLGLAVAILVDATLVRMVLVPATMELLGDANWWLPRWLQRILPRIAVEGHDLETEPATSAR